MRAVVRKLGGHAPIEVLRILGLNRSGIENKFAGSGQEGVAFRNRLMAEIGVEGDLRIEARHGGSALSDDAAAGADASARRAHGRAVGESHAGQADALWSRRHSSAYGWQWHAGCGALGILLGEQ